MARKRVKKSKQEIEQEKNLEVDCLWIPPSSNPPKSETASNTGGHKVAKGHLNSSLVLKQIIAQEPLEIGRIHQIHI